MSASNLMDWLQWPAFAASLIAAYLVASRAAGRRNAGFWIFLGSNLLWTVWGLHMNAWALVALQGCLAVLNVRGLLKAESNS